MAEAQLEGCPIPHDRARRPPHSAWPRSLALEASAWIHHFGGHRRRPAAGDRVFAGPPCIARDRLAAAPRLYTGCESAEVVRELQPGR